MSVDPQALQQMLKEAAGTATPAGLDEKRLRARVRRRRYSRGSAGVAGVAGLVAVGMIVVWPGLPRMRASGNPASVTAHGTSGAVNPLAGGPAVKCGDKIAWPTVTVWKQGTELKIRSIGRAADGSPRVSVDLVSREPTSIRGPQVERYARLLIVNQAGVVIAGQDTPARPGYRAPSGPERGHGFGTIAVSEARPFRMSLLTASAVPCAPLRWSQLPGGHNTLIVLMEAVPVKGAVRYLIARAPLE